MPTRTALVAQKKVTLMNKFTQKLLLLALTAFILLFTRAITPFIFDSDEALDSQITVSTEIKDISPSDIEEIKKEVRVALNSIPQILGIKYGKNTKIKIVDRGICYADGDTVSLSISHIRDKSAPIIHEVTHILTKHKHNSFFSEGLAVYFQERFGESHGFPNFSESVDALVKNYEDQLLHISKLKNDNKIFGMIGTEQRKIAYIEAGSFINFLVEKYGEQKLADLHNSRTLNYKKVYGKKFTELEKEWRSSVLGSHLLKA